MTAAADVAAELETVLARLVPPGVVAAARMIGADDAAALLAEEARVVTASLPARRRASGAARAAARGLLARLGAPPVPILRSPTGAPLWPEGFVGSLAHDEVVAVAVVAARRDAAGLGVDVEPAEPLPADVADLVVGAGDAIGAPGDPLAARLAFVAKEAVYKAVHPLCGRILDWPDITVDLGRGRAVTVTGHVAEVVVARAPRLVAVARIAPGGG